MKAQACVVGSGRQIHAAASGAGVVPAGRPKCEMDSEHCWNGRLDSTYKSRGVPSSVCSVGVREVTCHWCLTLPWLAAA